MDNNKIKNSDRENSNQQYITIPANAYFPNQQQSNDDEIDLLELWRAIWAGKFIIILITAVFAISSVFYALSLPNTYKASVLLAPASSEGGAGGLAGLASQFGGLASLAGVNLGGGGSDKTALALEVIQSRSFLEAFINKYDLFVPLMAVKSFNLQNETFLYNEEVYDVQQEKWVREVSFPKQAKPSSWEVYEEFKKIFSISQDKASGMVTATIEYYSPETAKLWLQNIVVEINTYIREQDQKEAQDSINYLTQKLEQTNIASMESVFYQLIEEQSKNMMLTQVKKEYVLKTIDPAQVPEIKSGPKRALIVILAILLGGILSVLFILIRYFTNSPKVDGNTSIKDNL